MTDNDKEPRFFKGARMSPSTPSVDMSSIAKGDTSTGRPEGCTCKYFNEHIADFDCPVHFPDPAQPPLSQAELQKAVSDILLGRAITDPEIIKKFNIKELTQAQAIRAIMSLITQHENQIRIDELESVLNATREITHPDAFVTDTGVAQSIRVHTNAFVEARIAQLRSNK